MVPRPSLPTNMALSLTSTHLEVQYSPKINYFANLLSNNDESNDEFDPFTISYPSNLVNNKSLPHSRTLAYFDYSIIIHKARVLELEKNDKYFSH
jgi:hypothetical protein